MIANQRGIYGDMNRKFSTISKDDKDLKNIEKIKSLILDKKVDLILNLHDGHGFIDKTMKMRFLIQELGVKQLLLTKIKYTLWKNLEI